MGTVVVAAMVVVVEGGLAVLDGTAVEVVRCGGVVVTSLSSERPQAAAREITVRNTIEERSIYPSMVQGSARPNPLRGRGVLGSRAQPGDAEQCVEALAPGDDYSIKRDLGAGRYLVVLIAQGALEAAAGLRTRPALSLMADEATGKPGSRSLPA